MAAQLPRSVMLVLLALCGLGMASIFMPWAVIELFGAAIPLHGYQIWTGKVCAGAFGILAVTCFAAILWPRLPWFVPLTLATVVGVGAPVLAVGPNLLFDRAEVLIAGRPASIPETIAAGKYLASGAGLLIAGVAGGQWWFSRRPGAASGGLPRPVVPADGSGK